MERINHTEAWQNAFTTLMQQKGGCAIERLACQFAQYTVNNQRYFSTLSEPKENNCYVVAPSTLLLGYGQDELIKLTHPIQRAASKLLLKLASLPLRWAKVDKLQVLNNQCLSTNMYDESWQQTDISQLRNHALERAPQHALMLRSLNTIQQPKLIASLKRDNWLPIVTRQVYVLTPDGKPGTDFKQDTRLANQAGWHYRPLQGRDEFQWAKRYYDMLYLEKYSQHNIRFTLEYMETMQAQGLMQFVGLFQDMPSSEGKTATLRGAVGFVVQDNTMTTPVFGFDTTRPQAEQLYRRLSWYTLDYAHRHQLSFNLSAGAPHYKRSRHAKPTIECSYVYVAHLSMLQRMVWQTLSQLTRRFYAPMLEKNQL
ncbi:hypothetical protein [Thaumasiovibrio subtropicus]|uniref:hypothetical protein n=1 Tax=Thaumasiovibrio subtropicus TaxID=1891207 RepID=UPI000B360FF1|nr:hypothetical protein [Thaumasiovibrio subtropicus]